MPQLATLPISRSCLFMALLAMGCHAPVSHAGADFSGFLADFRHALAENDGARLVALTRLPFLYEGRGRDRAAFLAIYPQLFNAPVRRCMARAQPIAEDGAQVIFCSPYAFYFRPVQGSWRLVEFAADGEALP